jgi:hypothetical protein
VFVCLCVREGEREKELDASPLKSGLRVMDKAAHYREDSLYRILIWTVCSGSSILWGGGGPGARRAGGGGGRWGRKN